MVTVEIPIVCAAMAAGLGVRGVVTPWDREVVESSATDSTEANRMVASLSILCQFWLMKAIVNINLRICFFNQGGIMLKRPGHGLNGD